MGRSYYFLLTSLPPLPDLGGRPALTLAELQERAAPHGPAARAVDAVLLEADLLTRESILAGQTETGEAAVLSAEQARGEQPLPEYLTGDAEGRRSPTDAMWEAYYRHVAAEAAATGCEFLRRMVGFEVSLRNALAAERARVLQLEPSDQVVAGDLVGPDARVDEIVTAFASASDPLRALRAVDEARLAWVETQSRYFSFSLDEVAAYARGLVLAVRWATLADQQRQTDSSNAA